MDAGVAVLVIALPTLAVVIAIMTFVVSSAWEEDAGSCWRRASGSRRLFTPEQWKRRHWGLVTPAVHMVRGSSAQRKAKAAVSAEDEVKRVAAAEDPQAVPSLLSL